jgi:hypothetical protein
VQPIEAVHAQLAVDNAQRMLAHQAGAARVIAGAAIAARVVEQFVVGLDLLRAGQGFLADEALQCRCGKTAGPPNTSRR